MANSEKLGTCSQQPEVPIGQGRVFASHKGLHVQKSTCVNWREQPQEPSRMVTEVSAEQPGHFKTVTARVPASEDGKPSLRCNLLGVHGLEHTCVLTEASEGGEKPRHARPQCGCGYWPKDQSDFESHVRRCSYWWCENCEQVCSPSDVTFEERHTLCGEKVYVRRTEPATPAPGAPTDKLWTRDEIIKELKDYGEHQAAAIFILKEAEDLLAASPRSGMGAREFYEKHKTNIVNVPRVGHPEDKSGWDGVRSASQAKFIAPNVEVMPIWDACDFAEAYAAEQVRQAYQTSLTRLKMEINLRRKAEAEVEKLRQERDDDEQMWRERCDAASKAGYEVAMEQERESRERVEGALREIVHSVGKLAEESGEDWRLKHAELMDAYEAGVLAVKSSEGEAK